jgi:hypothetical protein
MGTPRSLQPTWENFLGLFQAINSGQILGMPAFDGGLLAIRCSMLAIPDAACDLLKNSGVRLPHQTAWPSWRRGGGLGGRRDPQASWQSSRIEELSST